MTGMSATTAVRLTATPVGSYHERMIANTLELMGKPTEHAAAIETLLLTENPKVLGATTPAFKMAVSKAAERMVS